MRVGEEMGLISSLFSKQSKEGGFMTNFNRYRLRMLRVVVLFLSFFVSGLYADWVTTSVGVGNNPQAIAVDTRTNKVYVANRGSNTVTVIDGATNDTTTVPVGTDPWAIAVNTRTNKVYVANHGSGDVTVIDGATNATTTVPAGDKPDAICVNPRTNKVYVADSIGCVTVIDGATNDTTTVPVTKWPYAICVNPNTNKVYVANLSSHDVTVIDGETNDTTTINTGYLYPTALCVNPNTNKVYVTMELDWRVLVIDGETNNTTMVWAGINPNAICVNPNTNKVYVANRGSDNVTVIEGATNDTTLVSVGDAPQAICVNPNTNKVYVANTNSNTVTVIDGETNETATLGVGGGPGVICVNPNTNKVYVGNWAGATVTVIDGETNGITTIGAGTNPAAICMDPDANKVYVVNRGSNTVTVVDGATNDTTTIGAGTNPSAICVNPNTDKVYVANSGSDNVTVIDGETNDTTTVAVGTVPYAICVNPRSNKVYVINQSSDNVTVIDGATNATTTVGVGTVPYAICVNPRTNKVYVANNGSNTVTVIEEVKPYQSPLSSFITPFADDTTTNHFPQFNGFAVNQRGPCNTKIMNVLYRIDDTRGPWNEANITYASDTCVVWQAQAVDSLTTGFHTLYVVALDMTSATINMTENFTGSIASYNFLVMTLPDTAPPVIYNLYPPADTVIAESQPGISAHYYDAVSGIDTASIVLTMNGDTVDYAVITDSMITATPPSPLADTTYDMVLSVSDSVGNEAVVSWRFEVDATSPFIPILISPANDTVIATNTPTFIWGTVTKNEESKATPVTYTLQCAVDSGFNYTIIDTSGVSDTVFTVVDAMPEGIYYWHVEAVDSAGNHSGYQSQPFKFTIGPAGIEAFPDIPLRFSVSKIYPNPFMNRARLVYQLPADGAGRVSLKIYDLSGGLIRNLVDEEYKPGYYAVVWDGRDDYHREVPSGVYFYRFTAGKYRTIRKVCLIK